MKLDQIQGAIVRLDSLDKLMSQFNEIAMTVSDGGTGVEFEMRLKKSITTEGQKPNIDKLTPCLRDLISEGEVTEISPGFFGINRTEGQKPKPKTQTQIIEIKPTDIETLMVLGVFITRMKEEKDMILRQLEDLGVQITNTK